MHKDTRWNWLLLLVLVVVGGSCWLLWPPAEKLKLGLGLRGGTVLMYEVALTEDQPAAETIDQIIEVLKERVDPAGVMNLTWKRLAGNRFEVQMPAPSPNAAKLRKEYGEARAALSAANLSRAEIERVLRLPPEERAPRLAQLAGGDETLQKKLQELEADYQHVQDQERASAEAEQAHDEAEKSAAPEEEIKSLLDARIREARLLNEARTVLGKAWREVLALNVDDAMLDAGLSLPTRDAAGKNPRAEKLDQLRKDHPARAAQIDKVAQAYADYEAVKGPLDDAEDLKRLMRGSGILEFRIAATPQTLRGQGETYREQLRQTGPRAEPNAPYRWFVIDDLTSFAEKPRDLQDALDNPAAYFELKRGLIAERFGNDIYLLLSNQADSGLTALQAGWKLDRARPMPDERGFPAVSFQLNAVGGQLMGRLTQAHIGEPMAIVLDGRVKSAPNINSQIFGNGIITGGSGGFDQKELDYLVRTLNAGSLQARISPEPINEKTFDARFGADNLEAGLRAAKWSFIAVALFMVLYYFVNGLIADFALAANVVIILGAMAMLDATFTLPGIAGIVLTIGMAVDANVLIYERMREEMKQGVEINTVVRLGFSKAFSTIVDSNLTTLITAIVLGYTATVEVKGFAITLGIGILATLFTALVCTRVWTELFVRWSGVKRLPMLPTAVPAVSRWMRPKVNWIALRPIFFFLSAVLIIGGFFMIFSRAGQMMDVEFRSGTQVSFNLAPDVAPMTLPDVRKRLIDVAEERNLPDLHGDRAQIVPTGEMTGAKAFRSFTIDTIQLNADPEKKQDNIVTDAVIHAFADVLDVKTAVAFRDDPAESLRALTATELGPNIGRPDVSQPVEEFIGGVAIVVRDLQPAMPVEEIRQRIEQANLRVVEHGHVLGYRKREVIGLDHAADQTGARPGQPLFDSVAVIVRDDQTNYLNNDEILNDPHGLALTEWNLLHEALARESSLASVTSFSPQVSRTMQVNALFAIVLSLLAMCAYIWLRFGSLQYGLVTIAALGHDVVIALGFLALADWMADHHLGGGLLLTDFKIDLAVIAAILTLIGYSINDKIVVLDRIRENRGRLSYITPGLINESINQVLSRTLLTGSCTLLALIVLYTLGGPGVHGFAYAMFIGVVVGTYSSIVAALALTARSETKSLPATIALAR